MQVTRAQAEAWADDVNAIIMDEYVGGGSNVREMAIGLLQASSVEFSSTS